MICVWHMTVVEDEFEDVIVKIWVRILACYWSQKFFSKWFLLSISKKILSSINFLIKKNNHCSIEILFPLNLSVKDNRIELIAKLTILDIFFRSIFSGILKLNTRQKFETYRKFLLTSRRFLKNVFYWWYLNSFF